MKEQESFENALFNLIDVNLAYQQLNRLLEVKSHLSVVQWSVLKKLLEMPAVSAQSLAKNLGITPGTLTQTLGRLEKRHYIFVCEDPKDARKKIISITRSGKQKLHDVTIHLEGVFSEINSFSKPLSGLNVFLREKASLLGRGAL